jgi:uncharacterized OB-fold protein
MCADLQPHFDALAVGELRVSRCGACGQAQFPPCAVCGNCAASATEWISASGYGVIWSFVVFHKRYLLERPPPYVVAVVELVEGPKMFTNIVGIDPRSVRIGMAVKAFVEPGPQDGTAPRALFRPADTGIAER